MVCRVGDFFEDLLLVGDLVGDFFEDLVGDLVDLVGDLVGDFFEDLVGDFGGDLVGDLVGDLGVTFACIARLGDIRYSAKAVLRKTPAAVPASAGAYFRANKRAFGMSSLSSFSTLFLLPPPSLSDVAFASCNEVIPAVMS